MTDVPAMKKMSMDNYMQTGQQTESEYIDTASPELKAANAKYEGKQKEDRTTDRSNRTQCHETGILTAYLRYINDPSYIPVSIDKRTLVEKSNVINKDGWRDITSSRAGYQVHTVKMKSNWSFLMNRFLKSRMALILLSCRKMNPVCF